MLLAEDQTSVREAFATMLGLQDDINVVAVASTGRETVNLAWLHQPNVALVDVQMPDGNGFLVVEQLRPSVPSCRCIMLTTFDKPGYVHQAYEQGAWAYLTKTLPFSDIVQAVRQVHSGKRLLGPKLACEGSQSPLTARETEVLRTAARMSTTAKIATAMHLSQGTINNYISSILAKLDVDNRAQAIMIAQNNGWL